MVVKSRENSRSPRTALGETAAVGSMADAIAHPRYSGSSTLMDDVPTCHPPPPPPEVPWARLEDDTSESCDFEMAYARGK